MEAGFLTVKQIVRLAGCDLLTMSPGLRDQLEPTEDTRVEITDGRMQSGFVGHGWYVSQFRRTSLDFLAQHDGKGGHCHHT